MSISEPIKITLTKDQLQKELTQKEKEYAKEQNLDPVEVYKATRLDYSNLTKHTITSSKCPIQNFTFTSVQKESVPSKEQLAKKYYEFIDSTPKINLSNKLKLDLPKKTETDLIKPVNVKIIFNGNNSNPQFDYISTFTNISSTSKIINHITSAISHFNFIDSTDSSLSVYQSLCNLQDSKLLSSNDADKPKEKLDLFYSYGLYGLHNGITSTTVHNFKSNLNDFIYQTIDRKFNKSNKYVSQNEYYSLFEKIFISQDGRLKSSLVSSLIIPNILNEFISSSENSIYNNVPHATKNTLFNNFNNIQTPCNENIFGIRYIPTFYTSTALQNTFLNSLSGWTYPFIKTSVDISGNLTPNISLTSEIAENMAFTSLFISRDITADNTNNIVFDDKHQFTLSSDYNKNKYLLEKPTVVNKTIKGPTIRPLNSYIIIEKIGTMVYNPNKNGGYCDKWGRRKYGSGHGDSHPVNVYKLIYKNGNGTTKTEDNIGKKNAPNSGVFRCESSERDISPGWMAGYAEVRSKWHYSYTCNKNEHPDCNNCIVANLGDGNTIANNVQSKMNEWGINYKLSENDKKKIINEVNSGKDKIEIQVSPFSERGSDNTYYYKFGNALTEEEQKLLLSSTIYSTNSKDKTKTYSATFGALTSDVYIYDDRFFYILYKYFMTNKNLLCDVFESEILNYFLKHPELLVIYRIQKGYLKYALSKLHTINPTQNLSVVQFDSQDEDTKNKIHAIENNTSCFMNIESPIIGAMLHSDTLNMLDYNDYISDSMTKFKVKEFETNDGKVIALDMKELPYTSKNDLDSIYQNLIRSFGNISSNDLTIPGIFISDSGAPSDFINGENNSIKFVNVDAENGQKTLDTLSEVKAGTLIAFSFDSIGAFKKSNWTDNPELNKAISKAGSEQILNLELPYVMLLKQKDSDSGKIEYLFEYSTFTNNENENGIKVLYYRESENKSAGKTFLSRESMKMNNSFKFVKNYCGVYQQTNPFGRLITNYNVGDY